MVVTQVPPVGALNLDHVASFVPDRDACKAALVSLGFAPAPFSLQFHRLTPAGALVPAGSGNHCVMLREGYLEYLVPVSDTPVAAQLREAMTRYVGIHSIVFGTADAQADHRRLAAGGFEPLAPIALQRDVDTASGAGTARFTVVRVPPGTMAEGRVQFCQQHTEDLVWQSRWLDHPNGALALRAVVVCVDDPAEAARRYARFTGIEPVPSGTGWRLPLQRGHVELRAPGASACHGMSMPSLPWIAGCEVLTADLQAVRDICAVNALASSDLPDGRLLVRAPDALGGFFLFSSA